MNDSSSTNIFRRLCIILITAAFFSALTVEVRPSIASTDSTTAVTTASNIRGTDKPLERRASGIRHAGRALLVIPYAGMQVVSWPVIKGLQINEKYMIAPRLARLLYLNLDVGGVRTNLFFGYETNIGLGIVGLHTSANDWPVTGAELDLSGGYLSADKNLAAFDFRTPPHRFQWAIFGRIENKQDRPFFGTGPDSPDNRFAANRRRLLAETTLSLRINKEVTAAATAYARNTKISLPSHDEVPVSSGFPQAFLAAERNRYIGLESSILYDTRNLGDYSTQGHLIRLAGGINSARLQGDADYSHYEGEFQTHINLYSHTRVMALRVYAEGVDSQDPAFIPYSELPRLGGKTGLRGYNRYRFADRASMLLSAEYRYPVTRWVRGFIFGEWGSVASKWDDLRLADVDPAFGAGLSLVGLGPPILLHVAHSPEGFQFYFGTETIFSNRSRRLR